MPVIIGFEFFDGTSEIVRIPAEIWVRNNEKAKKVVWFDKAVSKITLDPLLETADTDVDNNVWPKQIQPSRFEIYKSQNRPSSNPMKEAKKK